MIKIKNKRGANTLMWIAIVIVAIIVIAAAILVYYMLTNQTEIQNLITGAKAATSPSQPPAFPSD